MSEQAKSYHFFIVDDDQATVEVYTRLIEDKGHRVSSAVGSKDALKQIFELQPDCVLCDLMMPDLDGIDLFNCIRLRTDIEQPKFVVVTGKIFDFDRRRALKQGVDGYLTKPINSDTFVDDLIAIVCK